MARTLTSSATGRRRGRPPKDKSAGATDPAPTVTAALADAAGNVTKETFTEFFDEAKAAKRDLADAQEQVRSANGAYRAILKRAKASGINHDVLIETLALDAQDHDIRERNDRDRRRYMEWIGKPLGTQEGFDFAGAPGDGKQPAQQPETGGSAHQEFQVTEGGRIAAKGGFARDTNPWVPGTHLHQVWDQAWVQQQAGPVADEGSTRSEPIGGAGTATHEAGFGDQPGAAGAPQAAQ